MEASTPRKTPARTPRKAQVAEGRGGERYEDIVGGVKRHYCFRASPLAPLPDNYEFARAALIDAVSATLADVEKRGRPVELFTVGKTTAVRLPTVPQATFNPFDPRQLDVGKHVGHRWHQKYLAEGYDGLVVLTVVTDAEVPKGVVPALRNPQDYVLALENAVTVHFAYGACDARLGNYTLHPGRRTTDESATAFCVYVAFKLRRPLDLAALGNALDTLDPGPAPAAHPVAPREPQEAVYSVPAPLPPGEAVLVFHEPTARDTVLRALQESSDRLSPQRKGASEDSPDLPSLRLDDTPPPRWFELAPVDSPPLTTPARVWFAPEDAPSSDYEDALEDAAP